MFLVFTSSSLWRIHVRFIVVTYYLGVSKDVVKEYNEGHLTVALTCLCAAFFASAFVAQNFSFIWKQRRIIEVAKNLQSMQEPDDEDVIKVCRGKCLRLLTVNKVFLAMCEVVFKLAGSGFFIFVLPSIHDLITQAILYDFLLVVNIINFAWPLKLQIWCMRPAAHSLFHSTWRKLWLFLCRKLRRCADGDDFKPNERQLASCIEHYCRIIA